VVGSPVIIFLVPQPLNDPSGDASQIERLYVVWSEEYKAQFYSADDFCDYESAARQYIHDHFSEGDGTTWKVRVQCVVNDEDANRLVVKDSADFTFSIETTLTLTKMTEDQGKNAAGHETAVHPGSALARLAAMLGFVAPSDQCEDCECLTVPAARHRTPTECMEHDEHIEQMIRESKARGRLP
jgi:hypothetical protein